MKYRREIDGLRAIAVLPVILFHAGFEFFSGGFVGVDVFFVISGYLITSIIVSDLGKGEFSFVNFYERRARRILPALFLVMLVCIPFAWLWLFPIAMKDFSQSLVAVPLFASNILFWRETGYFGAAAELKPLLHTWSLAVEEQYYLLFPVLMFVLWKLEKRFIYVTLALFFLCSLALAQWGALNKPVAAFYLLPTRGWELLLGAFAALYLNRYQPSVPRALSELGSGLGLTLIFFSVFTYDKTTPFPGAYALVPTVGTLLIILLATEKTTFGKLIGNPVLVGLGLISYSAYLWHQPIFAFARVRSIAEPSPILFLLLSVLALALAYLSWKFVERPFRSSDKFTRKQIFAYSLVVSVFYISVGLFGHYSNGNFAQPNYSYLNSLGEQLAVNHGLNKVCDGKGISLPECKTNANPEIMLWGDSYAMHLTQGLLASNPDLALVQNTMSVCGPILDIAPINARYLSPWAKRCIAHNDDVLTYLEKTPSIKYVVMSSPFRQFVDKKSTVLTRSGDVEHGPEVALDAMLKTIDRIKQLGKMPIIVSPPPQNGENIGACLAKAKQFNADISVCDFALAESLELQGNVYDFFEKLNDKATVINLADFLCTGEVCKTSSDNILIYRDGGHLSHEGSAFIGKEMNFDRLIRGTYKP